MLTKVTVVPVRGEDLEMLLGGAEVHLESLQLRDIEGLGPVNAQISTLPRGTYDGESLTGTSVGKRNIVLTIGLNPNWEDQSIAGLRNLLYEYVMPKTKLTLQFFSDHLPTAQIIGYVESCVPNIFSKDPEMQVSILCPDPDFVAVEATVVTGVTTGGVMRQPDLDDYTVIDYDGTRPTGFKLTVTSSVLTPEYGVDSVLTIANVIDSPDLAYEEIFAFDVMIDPVTSMEFSSVSGSKYVKRVTSGFPDVSLLNGVYSGETWPQLILGENQISVVGNESESPDSSGVGLDWTLEYFVRYGGL